MSKALITIGVALVIAGILWPILLKLPLGRLPGDIIIDKPDMKVYIPLTTMILFSLILSVLFALFSRKP